MNYKELYIVVNSKLIVNSTSVNAILPYLGVEPPPLSNINLLMAAAISSAWSEVNNSETECETPKAPISVEKAMEMWRNITDEGNYVSVN